MILNDWLRGKIPYFTPPPHDDDEIKNAEQVKEEEKVVEKVADDSKVILQYFISHKRWVTWLSRKIFCIM